MSQTCSLHRELVDISQLCGSSLVTAATSRPDHAALLKGTTLLSKTLTRQFRKSAERRPQGKGTHSATADIRTPAIRTATTDGSR
jgi:hypothetical protein